MGFILMYDITNEESFNAVQDWYIPNSFFCQIVHENLACANKPVLCVKETQVNLPWLLIFWVTGEIKPGGRPQKCQVMRVCLALLFVVSMKHRPEISGKGRAYFLIQLPGLNISLRKAWAET